METPPSIRRLYASPPREPADQRRRRLANRRAAKYRHFRSLKMVPDFAAELQRGQNTRRQRERRSLLDDEARERLRTQNRRRQQLWRHSLSETDKIEHRQKQRERQRKRRQTLDEDTRNNMRERARLRIGRQRRQLKRQQQVVDEMTLLPLVQPTVTEKDRLSHLRLAPELPTLRQHQEQQRQRELYSKWTFNGSVQVTYPPPPNESARTFHYERIPSLPHLQQVTRPTTSSLQHAPLPPALFFVPGPLTATSGGMRSVPSGSLPNVACAIAAAATRPPHPTPIMPSVSVPLPTKVLAGLPVAHKQPSTPRTPIGQPLAHRLLPALPDFLSTLEVFHPVSAAALTSVARPSSTSRTLFPFTDLPALNTDAQDWDYFFQR